tara:strand:- start:910 stop:1146 length:237 start_codon:yes stop_codon:yes gene_type:complete
MLNNVANNMNFVLSQEDEAEQLDQLWDMYAKGVNSALFDQLVVLSTSALQEKKADTNNIFHEIMIDFIIDYRTFYNTL